MKDTIEEKIINMHQTKRNIADQLLEGADLNKTLSEQELINLI